MSKKKMTLIADVFSKLETAKNVVKKMSRKSRFKPPFDSQHAKGYQTLLNVQQSTFTRFSNHSDGY